MAKKKNAAVVDTDYSDSDSDVAVAEPITAGSSPLDNILKANRKQGAGLPTWTVGELRAMTYGIEPYPLAVQYLFANNIIPMPAIMQIAGPPKTYKTSAAMEFLSFVLPPRAFQGQGVPEYPGGRAVFFGTEGKLSSTKVQSMLREQADLVEIKATNSTDEWQNDLTDILKRLLDHHEKTVESEKTGGKKMQAYYQQYLPPLAVVVDSLTGAQSAEMVEKLHSEGSVGRSFQERAIRNTNWFSVWASQLKTLPVFIMVTNHEKDPVNDGGMAFEKRTPGGVATNYYTSYDIRVTKIKELPKTKNAEGALLQWRMHHNSYGTDKRRIEIPYYEMYDENDNQLAFFNWDVALTSLLMTLKEDASLGDRISEHFNIVEHEGHPKTYSCEQLGISKDQARSEKITSAVMGKLIQSNQDYRKLFRKVTRIEEYRTWYPGVDVHRALPSLARNAPAV